MEKVGLIILILVLLGALLAYFLIISKNKNKNNTQSPTKNVKLSTQDFLNVNDILNGFMYSTDGYVFGYCKILPISIDLYSQREKINLKDDIARALSEMKYPFKIIKMTRTLDISEEVEYLNELYSKSEADMQKKLLKESIEELNSIALNSHAVERMYYVTFWKKADEEYAEQELLKNINNFMEAFSNCGIQVQRLQDNDIAQMINQFYNPSTAHLESYEDIFTSSIMNLTSE